MKLKVTIHYDDDDAVLVFPYYLYNYGRKYAGKNC